MLEQERERGRAKVGWQNHSSTVLQSSFKQKSSSDVWKALTLKRRTDAPGGKEKMRMLGHVKGTHFLISRLPTRPKAERNGRCGFRDVIVISFISGVFKHCPSAWNIICSLLTYLTLPAPLQRSHLPWKVFLDPQECLVPSQLFSHCGSPPNPRWVSSHSSLYFWHSSVLWSTWGQRLGLLHHSLPSASTW